MTTLPRPTSVRWSILLPRIHEDVRLESSARPTLSSMEVIGLIPAGGVVKRLAPLPCSKEIYPVGFTESDNKRERRPKAVCQYLLEKMRFAGIRKAFVVLRSGKWDIPSYLGDGKMLDMQLAYLMMDLPYGPPYTLNQASPFVKDALVAFGFPDILFHGNDGFEKLLAHQKKTSADIVLGLFPADQPAQMDMIDIEENCRVREIVIQPHGAHTLALQLGYSRLDVCLHGLSGFISRWGKRSGGDSIGTVCWHGHSSGDSRWFAR